MTTCQFFMVQKIKIVSAKGTTSHCISYSSKSGFLNQCPPIKKHTKIHTTEKLVCNTCNREIDSEVCRILITHNIDLEPQFFSFHFFAPCWNMRDFCKKYPNLTIDKMNFSVLENLISEKGIKDLQNNRSYWTTECG